MAPSRLRREPLISVVMPVRDGERHVVEAVESMFAQSFGDFELLAIEDGSSDATPDLLAVLQHQDDRMRVLPSSARGFVGAVRTGLTASRSPWIARMDADDISDPNRLQAQWSFLAAHEHIGLLGTSTEVIQDDGAHQATIRYPLDDALIRLCLRSGTVFVHGSVIMRRDALDEAGGYREDRYPAEDYDLWCRMVARGTQSANLDAPLYRYRLSPGSVSRTRSDEQAAAAADVGRCYGASDPRLPTVRGALTAVRLVDQLVQAGEADPRALRRAARSLLDSAPKWVLDHKRAALAVAAAGVEAEVRYRIRRRRT